MNRDVLLVYLKNIRDLEVAGYQLKLRKKQSEAKCRGEINTVNKQIEEGTTPHYWSNPKFPVVMFLFFLICAAGSAAIVYILYKEIADEGIAGFIKDFAKEPVGCSIALIGFIGLIGFTAFISPWAYFSELKEAKEHNKAEKNRIAQGAALVPQQKQTIQAKLNALATYTNGCTAELQNIGKLLRDAYSLNILPSQYRNLPAVYYIYDYMSTSQASLEDTLMHEHMENGIQRIMNKLDVIIAQNERRILLERSIEANTREAAENTQRMLSKQQQMLESMERTEQNTWEAAQAARIAAQYSEINTFFSAATYLERQR
jgi:hypothetical protein